MKKIISLILALTMICSLIAIPVSAETDSLTEVVCAPIEMDFFMDIFGTQAERNSDDWWYDSTVEGDKEYTYLSYKGMDTSVSNKYPKLRTKNSNDAVFVLDATSASMVTLKEIAEYDDNTGRYTFTIDGIKYRLGEIVEDAKGKNAFMPGVVYDSMSDGSLPYGKDEINEEIYSGDTTYVQNGKFPVNEAGAKAVNILAVSTVMNATSAYLMPVVVYYDDDTTESHWLAVGNMQNELMKSLVYSPASETDTYSSLDALKKEGTNTLDKIKSDISYSDITITPAFDDEGNSIVHNANVTYDSFIMPQASAQFADYIRHYSITNGKANIYSYSVPVDSAKTVAYVEFKNVTDAYLTTKYYPEVGAYSSSATASNATAYVPVNVKGISDEEYNCYLSVTRSCGYSAVLGMTLTYPSVQDAIDEVEARIEALSDTYVEDEAIEVVAINEAIEEILAGGVATRNDFDADLLAKLDNLVALAENAAKQQIIKAVEDKIDALSDTFVVAEIDAITEAKKAYDEVIAEGNLAASDFDAVKIAKLLNLVALAEENAAEADRVEKLKEKEMYYYPIEYNRDVFFTVAEALEYGVFDTKVDGSYVFPEKDLEGNPLDTTAPWFGYKGFIRSASGTLEKGVSGFLIDSIEGVEGQVSAKKYKSPTDYTITTVNKKLVINGNKNFELQSTAEDGAKNYIYNANGFKYKMGPIGGTAHKTAEGGNNARALGENEVLKFERTQAGAKKFGMLLASKQNNEGTSYASLQQVEIAYANGDKEVKYLVVTNMTQDADSDASTDYDGDRLGRLVVAVPKTVDQTTGKELKANAKIVSEKTSEELIGKAITVEDVVFPSDFIVGESVAIADLGIGRNSAVTNPKRYCPGGYANHYEIDFNEDVDSITYKGNISYGKSYPGAILNGQVAYIPVEIPGASEDYLYYARFGRPCGYYTVLLGASSMGSALEDKIADIESKIAKLSDTYVEEEAIEVIAIKEEINALLENGVVIADFNAALISKLNTLAAKAERIEELSAGEAYDTLNVDWNYKDNTQYLINAFEMSSVVSIERTTTYYDAIKNQSYINTRSTIEHISIEEALATEDAEEDGDGVKNFTTSGVGYSYYPTDKIQEKTGTFPASDGKYYITSPKGAKFEIKGVTNTVGGNSVNAGYVTFNDKDEDKGSVYKIELDGKTQYNNVNVLVAGVAEPVSEGSARMAVAAQATVYYADGTVGKQLIVIPSVWGYIPSIAGKLKTEEEVTGLNKPNPYKTIKAYSKFTKYTTNDEKFNWVPGNVDAEVFSLGSYMTTAFTNTVEERHEFSERTNKSGSMASVSIDTKGKEVDYIEISYAEDETLAAAGAFSAATNADSHVYYLPVSTEDVLNLYGDDSVGLLTDLPDAKISECDFYLKIQRSAIDKARQAMAIMFSATGEKKYENLLAYVNEANTALESISADSKFAEIVAAKEAYEYAMAQDGILATDFDAKLVENVYALYEASREKAEVSGEIEFMFDETVGVIGTVKLTNLAELAGKKYTVVLTYINEKGFVVGSKAITGESTAAKTETVDFDDENVPAETVKVKAYIWKTLGSLKPLGETVTVEKTIAE